MATITTDNTISYATADAGHVFSHKKFHQITKVVYAKNDDIYYELENWDEITDDQASKLIDEWCTK